MQTKHIDVMVRNVGGKFDEDGKIVNRRIDTTTCAQYDT